MDQQKRLFLTLVLSFGLIVVFQQFVWGPELEAERAKLAALDAGTHVTAALARDGGEALAPVAVPQLLADGDGGTVVVAAPPVEAPLRTVESRRVTTTLAFSSEGAVVSRATLLGPREKEEPNLSILQGWKKLFGGVFPPPPQMEMARPLPTGPGPFAVSITGDAPLAARQRYAVAQEAPGKVVFTTQAGPWQVTKTFTFDPDAKSMGSKSTEKAPQGYEMQLEVALKNVSERALTGELVVHTARGIDPGSETAPSMMGGIGNQAIVLCRVGEDMKRLAPKDEGHGEEHKGLMHFVGIDQQYFLSAAWPKGAAVEGRCVLSSSATARQADLAMPLSVAPGESQVKSFGLFLGPKDMDVLLAVERPTGVETHEGALHPALDKSIDFGLWAVICKALSFFLRFFHALLGNWGVAIITLTVLVKLALLPLTHRAMVAAEQMKKLQPRMEELKKKFADDKERQNSEMMKLYQEAKVNPLGGCLPLLVQLPIWGALFTTLRASYELYGEPFYGVWSDLTSKDPTYLLPLALGVTMIITQRLQPQMMDKSQVFLMTWFMPIFFTAIMMNYPAGLSLYIFTNNLLSIAQQYALRKWLTRNEASTPTLGAKA